MNTEDLSTKRVLHCARHFWEAEEAYRDGELTADLARGVSMVTRTRSVSVGAESTGIGTVSLPCPR